jgi:putative transposase
MSSTCKESHRKSTRLMVFDYSQAGAYFITIVTHKRQCFLGKVVGDRVVLSPYGKIAFTEWFKSSGIRQEIELHDDEFVIMPNHIHGIAWISTKDEILESNSNKRSNSTINNSNLGVRATGRSPLRNGYEKKSGPLPKSLGSFIAGYKASVTKQINQLRNTPGTPVWLRNYHDRVIRNERELTALRQYIGDNPLKWELDRENPKRYGHVKLP